MNLTTFKNMHKKFVLAIALALCFSFTADAQKIAIVDVQKVLSSMTEYQSAQDELDRVAAGWRQDIAKEYDKIKSMYNSYQAEQVLLSDDARRVKEDEIVAAEKAVRDLQKEKFGPEGALFQKRKELVQPIQEKVYTSIEDYAKERGYDFIFDKGSSAGLIFSKLDAEKTDEIIKRVSR
ncbi:MAG: outer membrane protein [Saprospiraceae bacterium]|jgi:outer membrane protein